MKTFRTFFVAVVLTLVLTGSALAGETLTPPCPPGETLTPPCTSAPVSGDSTTTGEIQTPPAGVDFGSVAALALNLLLY